MTITLALDLEGTLISNALPMDCTARPGLWQFLSWAKRHFRVVLYTNVFTRRARASLRRIVRQGYAPAWLARVPIFNPPLLAGEPAAKDLRLVGPLGGVYIVDDSPGSIRQDQRPYWIKIKSFWEGGQNDELERIQGELTRIIESKIGCQINAFVDSLEQLGLEGDYPVEQSSENSRPLYYAKVDLPDGEVIKEDAHGNRSIVSYDYEKEMEIHVRYNL